MHTHGTQRAVSCRILFLHVFKPTYFGQESLGAKYCKHSYKIKYYFRWTSSSIKFLFIFFLSQRYNTRLSQMFDVSHYLTRNFEVIESKFRDIKPRILLLDSILSCYLFIYFCIDFCFCFVCFKRRPRKAQLFSLYNMDSFSVHPFISTNNQYLWLITLYSQ